VYFDGTFSFRNNFIMYFESNSSEKLILLSRASGKISSQLEKFDMLSISVWQFLFVYFSGIFFIAFLGILGKETGIRRLYVKILLKVFEVSIPVSSHLRLRFRTELLPDIVDVMMRLLQWGRVKIERAMKRKTSQEEQLAQLDLDAGGSSGDGNQIICREETLVLAPGLQRNASDQKLSQTAEQGAGDGISRPNGKVRVICIACLREGPWII
jgi:hypothetical protein